MSGYIESAFFHWICRKAKEIFVQTLSITGKEHRLGKILHDHNDLNFLIHLFVSFHKKHRFMDLLYSLRTWDPYTFVHSFDVFILGTIFARKLRVPHLETVALGYLLHDIGKIAISPKLLNKQGKLTMLEFEEITKTYRER